MVQLRKREGTTVDRFKPAEIKETAKTVVAQGKGEKLGEIPNVSYKLDKIKGTDEVLEQLHTLLFKSKGKALSRKKDIKAFSGFVYEGEAQEEAKKVEARLNKHTLPQLHAFMDLLDISRGTEAKEKKAERILEFLEKPKALGEVDLRAKADAKKEKAAAKREKVAAKKQKTTAKKADASAKKEKATSSTKKATGSAKKTTPGVEKTATKKATPAKKTSAKKDTTAKKEKAKQPAKKTPASPSKAAGSSKKRKADDTEEQPSKKKAKTAKDSAAKEFPSDEQLLKDIEVIVDELVGDSDLIKLGSVYNAIGNKYNMTKEEVLPKRGIIKETLQKFQAKLQEAKPEEEPEVDADAMEVDEPKAPVAPEPAEVAPLAAEPEAPAEIEPVVAATVEEPAAPEEPPQEPVIEEEEPEPEPAVLTEEAPLVAATEPTPELEVPLQEAPIVEDPPQDVPAVAAVTTTETLGNDTQPQGAVVLTEVAVSEPVVDEPATFEGDELQNDPPHPAVALNPREILERRIADLDAAFDPNAAFDYPPEI